LAHVSAVCKTDDLPILSITVLLVEELEKTTDLSQVINIQEFTETKQNKKK
jgi:hypothetical protein